MKKLLLKIIILVYFAVVSAMAYEPVGKIEDLYRLDYLPLLRPGVNCKMFSSYDRSGGNDDGFNGTWSSLRTEDGNSVLAEMNGAGCIQRIWFTHSSLTRDGLLKYNGEHIRIYLDGSDIPALDVPLENLFSSDLPQFPEPLAGSGTGGFYCYVPIPYRDGCKVVVEGTDVRFYQITYSEFPDSEGVETFSMEMTSARSNALKQAVDVWSSPEDQSLLGLKPDAEEIIRHMSLEKGEIEEIILPEGSHMVRSIVLDVAEVERTNALSSLIMCTWDDAENPAMQIPLAYLFGQVFDPQSFQSLLFGVSSNGFYNHIPMPYRESATIHISATEAFEGTVKFIVEPTSLQKIEFGYFHADYAERLPTINREYYPLLETLSCGHYLGMYLATEAEGIKPIWLEGDETFVVDDELMIHGTGTEDYFNCGWYSVENRLDRPGSYPLHGFPLYTNEAGIMRTAAYRWHISDVVPYQNSMNAKLEHWGVQDSPADYRSAVFYYDRPYPPETVISVTELTVPEASTNTFGIKLSIQPDAETTVTVTFVSGDSDLSVQSGSSLVFTTTNWMTHQWVTLAAAPDDDWFDSNAIFRCSSLGMADFDITATEDDDEINPDCLLPWSEPFEVLSQGSLDSQHSWVAGVGATVSTAEAQSGTQSLSVLEATASHTFDGAPTHIWIEFWSQPFRGVPPDEFPAGLSAVFYVNTNDQLTAYDLTNATVITSPAVSNGWNKFEIQCDYFSKVWNLELNDTLVVSNFAFYGSPASFGAFEISALDTEAAFVDSIFLSESPDDTDSDGLPDVWENTYYGDLSPDPLDSASNGVNTVIEAYIAGLDPTDSTNQFLFSSASSPLSSVLSWNSLSGRVYTVYWTSNLLNGFFQTLKTNLPWTPAIFTDSTHSAEENGFYKIEVELE